MIIASEEVKPEDNPQNTEKNTIGKPHIWPGPKLSVLESDSDVARMGMLLTPRAQLANWYDIIGREDKADAIWGKLENEPASKMKAHFYKVIATVFAVGGTAPIWIPNAVQFLNSLVK